MIGEQIEKPYFHSSYTKLVISFLYFNPIDGKESWPNIRRIYYAQIQFGNPSSDFEAF